MLDKNIQKMNKRKNKKVIDDKKAAKKERLLPRNRQVQNYFMKFILKLLWIVVLSLLWCNVVYSAKATCSGGECEFMFSAHYEWVETSCYQTMWNEEVETIF